jgi:hypothetical protein
MDKKKINDRNVNNAGYLLTQFGAQYNLLWGIPIQEAIHYDSSSSKSSANAHFTTCHIDTIHTILYLGTLRYETPSHFPSSNIDSAAYTINNDQTWRHTPRNRSLVPKGFE